MKNKALIIPVDILKMELLVCVGVTEKYFYNWLKKNAIKELKSIKLDKDIFNQQACCYNFQNANSKKQYYFIFLKDFINDWIWVDDLLHEVVHFKQFIFKNDRIGEEEVEFEAYFVESVFTKIRKELSKEPDKKVNQKKRKKG